MRSGTVVIAFLAVCAPCVVVAQVPAAPPTRVYEIGLYGCPTHADILATWPAQCPMCQTVLSRVQPAAFTRVSLGSWEPQRDQEWRERARQNEQWRQWGQRNEQLRQQARRNAELREQARRNEGFRQPYPNDGDYPPQGYAYPYPYNYYYNPNTGQYEYLSPGYAYPYGGYQYNPNAGLRYYNPNAGQYYYNPNAGHYYYNPYTGQYEYVNPRYTFTRVSLGPFIDMENRRRDEDEEAREAQRNAELREQARRNGELWGRYPNYGYYPPGGYPYAYPPPGYAYQYPYNYYYHPNTGHYGYVNPGYAYPYGAYSYNPSTGQYSYNPGAGQYYYNRNTGQYQYVNPGYAYPNRRNKERRAPQERERR